MKAILNKRNRNEKENIELVENNEKRIDEIILEKGKERITQYMNDKFNRLNEIRLKEEKIKIRRLREDIEIEREKEMIKFEEKIKIINLRNELKNNIGYYEEFTKKEKIISLIEEQEGENKGNVDAQKKKNSKKKKNFN